MKTNVNTSRSRQADKEAHLCLQFRLLPDCLLARRRSFMLSWYFFIFTHLAPAVSYVHHTDIIQLNTMIQLQIIIPANR